ncbi:MAG: hypothetical protein Q7K34_00895 [archaeon]|nr:hypothetical protein [archaeon]
MRKIKNAIKSYPGSLSPERRRARKAVRQKGDFLKNGDKLIGKLRLELEELQQSMGSFSGKPPAFSKNRKVKALQFRLALLQSQWKKLSNSGARRAKLVRLEAEITTTASELKQEHNRLQQRLVDLPGQIDFLEQAIKRAEQMEPEELSKHPPIGSFERFMTSPLNKTWRQKRKKGK